MFGLSVSYKGQEIASTTESGTVTLETAGTYCEDNISASSEDGNATLQTAGKFCEDNIAITYEGPEVIPVPSVTVGNYTYNGSAQGPTIGSYDSTKVIVSNATKTAAGTYTLTLSLANVRKSIWSDNTTADKTYEYTIAKLKVGIPTVSGSYTYDGGSKSASISYASGTSGYITQSGTASATNANSYTVYFNLKDTSNTTWSDGTTSQKSGSWSIGRASITLPAQSGSLTYTGNTQTPSWNSNYNSSKMTLSVSGQTNAGTYSASFTPTSNYKWSDGSTSAKSANWTIGKASGSLSLNPTSLSLNNSSPSKTITVTRAGNGTISVSSSNTSVATVSLSGTTVTVTGKKTGSATITVSVAAGTNHNAPSNKTCSVTASFATIYGASWDGTSTTAWTRTDAAASFSDPVPYVAGATNYSSPFDGKMPWSGMTKSTRTGGVMVAIPKFYYKLTQNGKGIKVQIADGYMDGFSVSPAHLKRGSETSDRDVVYIGRYHCSTSNYKSTSGVKPKTNVARSTARSGIHNLGSTIWQCDFAMIFTIWLLYIVEFANWDSQAKIGYGCGDDYSTENMGYTDSMPYHTGTTQSRRTTYGLGTQYRNIEGLWDNVCDWMDGCYYNSNGLNVILNPSSFSDSSNGTSIGTPSDGYPSAFSVKNVSGTFPTFIPTSTGGNDSSYSCDYWVFLSFDSCLCVGADYNQDSDHGLFGVGCNSSSSGGANVGCRLQELP